MSTHQASRRNFPTTTKLREGLWQNRSVLKKIEIRSFLDLRKAVAANRLQNTGVGIEDLKEFASFAALSRIFPSSVALVLQEQGADGLPPLIKWNENRFVKALVAGGLTADESARERQRFTRFLDLIKASRHPEDLTGLQVDLGEDYALLNQDASKLAKAGVETLTDWTHLQSSLKVNSGVRKLLNGYARLSVFGFEPKAVKQLLDHKIDSAITLARQSDSELQRIANQTGIKVTVLNAAHQMAGYWTDDKVLDIDDRLPGWDGTLGGRQDVCVICLENESVFSKFAYYLYLVAKTEQTFFELENTLFQEFSQITPADEEEILPQVVVCNEIIHRALGRYLSQEESLPVTRYQILSILQKVVPRSPAQIVSFAAEADAAPLAADLLPRLIAAYSMPLPLVDEEMLNPQPVFTWEELGLLKLAGEAILTQEIQADPTFTGTTPEHLQQAVMQRIEARAQEELEFEHLIRRAVLKKAHNLTDRALFENFFIETDLALCERTTRLDQAIQTLQTYLTKNSASKPAYLSFKSWRGEMLGQKYPETALLLRDDVLVGDTGIWDRGSILLNHSTQHAELRSQLSLVRRAINDARVDPSNRNVTPEIWDELSRFQDEPSYDYFQRGLTVIDNILEANDQIYRATGDLDREEPGLALGRLQAAVSLLDRVDGELFENDWFWANQETNLKRYAELVKVNPETRKERLQQQFFNFAQSRKKLFELQQTNQTVTGLTDLTILQVGHSDWTASPEFEQGDSYIVRNGTESGSKFSEFRYDNGAALEDYTFTCEFRAQSYWRSGQPDRSPKVGVGFRLQDGSQGGYRLAVLASSRFYENDDDSYSVPLDLLALQKVSTGGTPTTLDEYEIGTSNYTRIEGSTIQTNHWYSLTITASGGRLTGLLRITPEKTISIGPIQDPTFGTGTISIFVGGSAEVEFRNLSFRSEAQTGVPPFFAQRRSNRPIDLRSNLSDADYWIHRENGDPMSLSLVTEPLARPIDIYKKRRLAGAQQNGSDLFLTLPPGGSEIELNRLDLLLERCLMLTYYLRFAAIPLRMAQAYLAMGEYRSAVDLLHILYDEEPDNGDERRMYPFFYRPPSPIWADIGADAAAMRLRLGEVYLRWAEMLFRQNTTISRFEARRLYERVLQLHYRREGCDCDKQRRQASTHVLTLARQAHVADGTAAARTVLRRNAVVRPSLMSKTTSWSEVQKLIDIERKEYQAKVRANGIPAKLRAKALERIKAAELGTISIRGMSGAGLTTIRYQNASGTQSMSGTGLTTIRRQNLAAQSTLITSLSSLSLCTPDNPLQSAQISEACLRLDMLKNCVNILGYSDSLIPPLRFETLLRVAQNFADLAQAAERDVLQFRQAFEQEAFTLMEAEANLEQADVEVAIDRLNVELAEGEITFAEIQQEQAESAVGQIELLVNEGMTDTEQNALEAADAAAQTAAANAIFSFATAPAQLVSGAAGGDPGQIIGAIGNAFSAQASALGMRASLERQQQDREFQLQQMRFGLSTALQSVSLAFQRWEIAQLQEELAGMKRDFAQDAFAFLNNKILSAAGWLMLMKMAREQYKRRLSYAIETAYLAERALAFELQNPALKIIRFDYYDARQDGLLGATQLSTDLAQLESRKLAFRQRKLQLSKTVSFAASFPAAFEQFRNGSGVFAFSMLPEMFDRDFPGHYLRLIQSVRVTVVALIPPTQGIRATLRNIGVSQVVVGPPYASTFGTRTIRRNPESVALSSPFQSSGLFVLDYKDELLLPFEGSGVLTDWVFEMPKAANQFNYGTIADVLMTVEYTALEGTHAYRAEVRGRLGREFNAELAYSFRIQFADQWYDLHNPELISDPAQQMVVTFEVLRADFPPNLDQLAIEHVALYFAHDNDASFDAVPVRYLNFANDGNRDRVDSDPQGVISTRRSSGSGSAPESWRTAVVGNSPVATWEISFNFGDAAQDQAIRQQFSQGRIRDILLVISYSGRAAAWP